MSPQLRIGGLNPLLIRSGIPRFYIGMEHGKMIESQSLINQVRYSKVLELRLMNCWRKGESQSLINQVRYSKLLKQGQRGNSILCLNPLLIRSGIPSRFDDNPLLRQKVFVSIPY